MSLKITHTDSEWCPKYYGVIVGLFCGLYMITMAINSKLFTLGGLVFPAGMLTFPLCAIIADLMTEIYGFNRTRQAVWMVLVCNILFAIFTFIAIHIPPADFWPHNDAYAIVFEQAPRLALAGSVAWIVGELINSYVMSRLKISQNARHMAVRFVASTVVGQFFDTVIFCSIGFAGTMPLKSFIALILSVWGAKIIYEIFALPLSIPITRKIKKWEGVEHFDDQQKISVI